MLWEVQQALGAMRDQCNCGPCMLWEVQQALGAMRGQCCSYIHEEYANDLN